MKLIIFFLLFLILLNQAGALMVGPAKIHEEGTMTVTNNLKETAEYTITSQCAKTNESGFELEPAEKRQVYIEPTCTGYLQVREESETAINRFNIPVEHKQTIPKDRPSLLVPIISFCIIAVVLVLLVGRIIRKGGVGAVKSKV